MRKQSKTKGTALLISVWALLLLSAALLAWVKFLDQQITLDAEANRAMEARAAAYSGVVVALHPLVTPQSPVLSEAVQNDCRYEVSMVGETGKLNLNWLLAGEDPTKLEILRQYLMQIGLNFDQSQKLVDCLLDWVDNDNLIHLNGAEAEGDYVPANRPFINLDEIKLVKGAAPLIAKKDWKNGFTLYTAGPLDLRYATKAAIAALPGVGERRAINFLQYRQGADKKDFTSDDTQFQGGIPAMLNYLGVGPLQQKQLNGLLTNEGSVFSIVSLGYSGKVQRRIEVVASKSGTPNIYSWKEL